MQQDFLANVVTKFNTFEYREAVQLDYDMIDKITLKDALLFRKMYIKSREQTLKFGTSRALLADFQYDNYNAFIKGEKQRVIFENGQFV